MQKLKNFFGISDKPIFNSYNYEQDYFKILEEASSIIKEIQSFNLNQLITFDDDTKKQLNTVFQLITNPVGNSDYLLKVIFSGNVKFNNRNGLMGNLNKKNYEYFANNYFPMTLFETEKSIRKIEILVLDELFNIKDIEFLKIAHKEISIEKSINEYNKKIIDKKIKSNAVNYEFINNLTISGNQAYMDYELLSKIPWFRDVVLSTMAVYISERFGSNQLELRDSFFNFFNNNFDCTLPIDSIYTFLLSINNKELLDKLYSFYEITQSIEFENLPADVQRNKKIIFFKKSMTSVTDAMDKVRVTNEESIDSKIDSLLNN